jgi:hypothetical protein
MSSEIKADKWSPATGTSATLGDSGDTFTIPSGATITNSGTATGFGITEANFRPNAAPLWYNGDMAVSQRATSTTGVTGSGEDGYKACDRMYMYMNNIGTWTFAQEALTSGAAYNAGFSDAFRIDCTTADASPAASDQFWIGMKFEGQDLQLIRKGTSSAQTMTLAFWVKSNKTGTGQVNFRDTDNSRMCSGTYTISSADTWEHKIINIAADTTGVFANDNAESLQVQWWIDAGSNFTSGTAPTAWEADASADRCANNLSLADNTANDFAITGVQLEVGTFSSSTLPPFQHETYGKNLSRCERYFQQFPVASGPAYTIVGTGFAYSATNVSIWVPMRTAMRSTPSFATTSNWSVFYAGAAQSFTPSFASDHSGPSDLLVQDTGVSGLTAGDAVTLRQNADASARLKCNSEL